MLILYIDFECELVSWRFVAYHYVTTSFVFDVITSVPVSTIEYILRQKFCTGTFFACWYLWMSVCARGM